MDPALSAKPRRRRHRLPGPEGDQSNLFATIGPKETPGYILSGHMDVVPAAESGWTSDPFRLRAEADRLYGRGATDMKGFLAAARSRSSAGGNTASPTHPPRLFL